MSSSRLNGKVAIVTGASGGFGRVIVNALLAEGAKVAALDINPNGLDAWPTARKADLLAQKMDISDYEACERAVNDTIRRLGGVHILINNAALGMGVIRADHMVRPVAIAEITPQMWQRFVATNFSGPWNMTRAAIAHLLAQRWGRIINITTSFFTMLRAGFHPYGPCKAGFEAMSSGHAKEFAGTGVTVNVVVPGGPADTPMVPEESGFARQDLISPAVMAPPILWLCSEAANDVTGNRYIAAHWDAAGAPLQQGKNCRAPVAWPELAQSPVWPGGRPNV